MENDDQIRLPLAIRLVGFAVGIAMAYLLVSLVFRTLTCIRGILP